MVDGPSQYRKLVEEKAASGGSSRPDDAAVLGGAEASQPNSLSSMTDQQLMEYAGTLGVDLTTVTSREDAEAAVRDAQG